jgi:hypothetical protein
MERNDVRVAAVLRELADLGRRIGEQAGELARLTTERDAGASQTLSPPTPRKAPTNPRERTTRTPGRPAEAKIASEQKRRSGHRSRPTVVPHRLPKSLRLQRRRGLAVGPGLVSGIVHLIVLLGLALMYVSVEAEPVRVAITLGETAEFNETAALDETAKIALEEVELLASESEAQPDNSPESLAEAVAAEPLADVGLPPSEELFADVQSADGTGVADVASFEPGDLLAEVAGGWGGGGWEGVGRPTGRTRRFSAVPVRGGASVSSATTPTAIATAASTRSSTNWRGLSTRSARSSRFS